MYIIRRPLNEVVDDAAKSDDGFVLQTGSEVYSVVSRRSHVLVEQLRRLKGSDASNVHDEEPDEGVSAIWYPVSV